MLSRTVLSVDVVRASTGVAAQGNTAQRVKRVVVAALAEQNGRVDLCAEAFARRRFVARGNGDQRQGPAARGALEAAEEIVAAFAAASSRAEGAQRPRAARAWAR